MQIKSVFDITLEGGTFLMQFFIFKIQFYDWHEVQNYFKQQK